LDHPAGRGCTQTACVMGWEWMSCAAIAFPPGRHKPYSSHLVLPHSVWRYLLLTLGFLTLTLLVWHIGPGKIYEAATQVGPGALLVILIPSLLMYVFEAYGWKLTLGSAAHGIAFWKIFAIRTAG